MYFRHKKTKTGQALQLVESFRDSEGKPRQRIVLSLGDASLEKHLWGAVAEKIEHHFRGIQTFLPVEEEVKQWADKIICEIEKKGWQTQKIDRDSIAVCPEKIQHHTTTTLGPELVALKAWETLGFSKLLTNVGFNEKQKTDAALSIMNRLLDPCSENALPSWVKTTSFEDLIGKPLRDLSEDRFYRIADQLLKNKDEIEKVLNNNERNLFSLDRTILLYDLTNTYFEGKCLRNPKAKRGNSKEKRSDAPLLSVGLVLDREGFVLKHEVFPGNTNDNPTLIPMIQKLQGEETGDKPFVIVDSGIASEDNLKGLVERGFEYIVVGKRPTRVAYEKEFAELPFKEITGREGKSSVHVSVVDKDKERVVLCYSENRAEKERQILSQAEKRYLEDLEKLQKRIKGGRLKSSEAIQRSLGKIEERNTRVARYYEVKFEGNKLVWKRIDGKYDRVWQLSGGYHLRCSRKDLDDETIWKLYMTLTRVESGFRTLKSTLGLRPVFHQREDRCDSHIFITVLAYRLLHWIEYTLRQQGETRSWSNIKRILQTHCYTTIVCPSEEGVVYHIRAPGTPDPEQAVLYHHFGIDSSKLSRKQTVL